MQIDPFESLKKANPIENIGKCNLYISNDFSFPHYNAQYSTIRSLHLVISLTSATLAAATAAIFQPFEIYLWKTTPNEILEAKGQEKNLMVSNVFQVYLEKTWEGIV